AFDALLSRRIAGVRQLTALVVADETGNIILSSAQRTDSMLPEAGMAALAYHRAHPTAGLQISQPFRGADGKWTAFLTRGITAGDSVVGIAAAYLNLGYFEDFYQSVDLSENGSVILHLRDGTVLARFPHVDGAIGTSFANTPPFKDVLSHDAAG